MSGPRCSARANASSNIMEAAVPSKPPKSSYAIDAVERLRLNDKYLLEPNFSCTALTDAEAISLGKTISDNTYAQTLNLNANGLSQQSMPVLANSLRLNICCRRYLPRLA